MLITFFNNDLDTTEIDDHETNGTPIPTGVQNKVSILSSSILSSEHQTPNGTRFWTPVVTSAILKYEISVSCALYDSWDEVLSSYALYAKKAGFSIRIGTRRGTKDGLVTYRHILCNRNGLPTGKVFDTPVVPNKKRVRRRNIKVCGCRACVKVKAVEGSEGFEVYELIEEHNHGLVDQHNMNLTLGKGKLEFFDKELIVNWQILGRQKHIDCSAMDHQRYNQHVLEFNTTTTAPTYSISLPIEQHDTDVYTRNIFLEVQKEIDKCTKSCFIVSRDEDHRNFVYTIAHQDHNMDHINELKEFPHDPAHKNKGVLVEEVLHQAEPSVVEYKAPPVISNKGHKKKRRLAGPGE
ncbi:hypothetical protein QVD17_07357 [Tagetes erecta]|uniref:FAR1 domain-containing protein n=1 Tax=Tagetes erecta TaxID=13708 RepID=A0AAD8PCW3_TARER|nr:hypothetical protein QVD17_07357 [Tagetes erecta]